MSEHVVCDYPIRFDEPGVFRVELPHGAVVLGAYFDLTPVRPSLVLVGAQEQPQPRGLVLAVLLEGIAPASAHVRRFVIAKHGQKFEAPAGSVVYQGLVGNTNAQLFEIEIVERVPSDAEPLRAARPRIVELDRCEYCGRTVKACGSDPCVGSGEGGVAS